MAEVVRYEHRGPVALVTMNRPEHRNAQNSAMTYALDDAFTRAVDDPDVKVIVLAGEGKHFSAGHDIGSPGRDADQSFDRRAVLWWDHTDKEGGDRRFARESEVVEYFAHPWVLGPRVAKEVLFTGERFNAAQAKEWGMLNRVVPRQDLEQRTFELAEQIAAMPSFGLALAKKAVNQAEDLMGLRSGMDSVFGLHHFAHAHNAETATDALAGQTVRSMRDSGVS